MGSRMQKLLQGSGVAFVWLGLVMTFPLSAAGSDAGTPARRLITQRLDLTKRSALPSHTRPELAGAMDLGVVADNTPMEHMVLLLRRPQEREAALGEFMKEQADPRSSNYLHWLTPREYGDRFGLAQEDLKTLSTWLRNGGFAIHAVQPNGVMIDFSGSAGSVKKYLGAEIHRFNVDGATHFANTTSPQVPLAIADAVVGIANLSDIQPKPAQRPAFAGASSSANWVSPSDVATIYNLRPLFQSGITGQGVTIATINGSNMLNPSDWSTFRSTYGLSGYVTGSMTVVHPGCADPGVAAPMWQTEAVMDPEMATISAPGATILAASCTYLTTALQYLITQTNPPDILSLSYIIAEQGSSGADYATYIALFKQAQTQGISVFVSSGDTGGSWDGGYPDATGKWHPGSSGLGVNGLASTPYNVAVGGTRLYGTDSWLPASSAWGTTNSPTYGSAQSYVPELPWNDSCANVSLASFEHYSTTYGSSGYCNSNSYPVVGGNATTGGGPSSCATGYKGSPTDPCVPWAKPWWQAGVFGVPNDNVRDLPDVSLVASSIAMCNSTWSSTSPCGNLNGTSSSWPWTGGGTSAAAPLMAGIQALINQKTHAKWGNPASIYYKIAAAQYGSSGNLNCNSNSFSGVAAWCVFNDITQGNNDYPCASGTPNCYSGSPASGTVGVLSLSTTSYLPAYPAASGWDFATGLGSVNAYNLAKAWPASSKLMIDILFDDCDSVSNPACE